MAVEVSRIDLADSPFSRCRRRGLPDVVRSDDVGAISSKLSLEQEKCTDNLVCIVLRRIPVPHQPIIGADQTIHTCGMLGTSAMKRSRRGLIAPDSGGQSLMPRVMAPPVSTDLAGAVPALFD